MFANLITGVATMMLCLILQVALLTRALIYYARHQRNLDSASFLGTLAILNGVLMLLLFGNLAQVAVWGWLFQLLGEFDDYATAFYHSAVNFATLGYGDIVMSEERRVLGPLQAMNGVLMIGVSTAAFMTVLRDAIAHSAHGWRLRRGAAVGDILGKEEH